MDFWKQYFRMKWCVIAVKLIQGLNDQTELAAKCLEFHRDRSSPKWNEAHVLSLLAISALSKVFRNLGFFKSSGKCEL